MAYNALPTVATSDAWTASQHNTYVKDNFSAVWVGTTAGDLNYYTSSTTKARLALVTGGVLYGGASAPAWLSLVTGGVMYGGASAPAWLSLTTGGVMVGGASAPAWLANTAKGLLHGGASTPDWLAVGAAHTFLKSEGVDAKYGGLVYQRIGGDATNWQTTGSTTYTPANTLIQGGSGSMSINPLGTQDITYPTEFSGRPFIFILANATGAGVVANYLNDATTGFTAQLYRPDGGSGSFSYNWIAIGAKS